MSTNATAASLDALSKGNDGINKLSIFRLDPSLIQFEPGFNLRPEVSAADGKDPLKHHLENVKNAAADGLPLDPIDEHINTLYLAMKNGAAVPPVDVRVDGGKVFCIDGHCRTIAGRRLRKEEKDFTLEARQFRGGEAERVLHMLGTGNGQKPLSPLEAGIGFLRLIKFGMTPAAIATKLGISTMTVSNNLKLAEAPVEVQKAIQSGVVSSTAAREAIQQGPEGVAALKEAIAAPEAPVAPGKKPAKKKKVTSAKLKGTAAAKKPTKKKTAAAKKETVAADEIAITVKKTTAQDVASFIRSNAPSDDVLLLEFAAHLETILM